MNWTDPRWLQVFGVLLILCLWLYLFFYSWRHKLPRPWGMGLLFIGILVTGIGFNYQIGGVVVFSLQPKFIVSIVGLALNIGNSKEQFNLRDVAEFLGYILIGIVAGLALAFITLFTQIPDKDYLNAFSYTKFAFVSLYLQSSIAEEILFRGWLLSYLKNSNIKFISANFIQSIIFAILHITNFYDNWGQLFTTFLLGFIGGHITQKKNNIISAIVLHVVFNLTIIWASSFLN